MTGVGIEDEAKFTLPADATLPSLSDDGAGLVADPQPPVVLRSVYYDTADRRLLAAGITVRRRTNARATTWDLKAPVKRGDTSVRHEVSLADRSSDLPARITDLLSAWTGGDPLAPIATLRTRRLTWTVRDAAGNELAEVVDDEVEHLDGRKVLARFREVEVERRGVGEAYVRKVARRIAKAGGGPGTGVKLGRVVEAPDVARPPKARPGGTVVALVAAALSAAGADLLAADVGARLGAEDAVHQLRVACRRMRSVLRGFGAAVDPKWRESLSGELQWVGQALAAARDAEVIEERVVRAAADLLPAAAPVLADVAARRAAAEAEVVAVLSTERYVALARRVRTELAAPPPAPDAAEADAPARAVARKVVAAASKDLRAKQRAALRKDATDAEWHAVRIAAKRVRYAAETAALVDPAARAVVRSATGVQDVLGTFHDATVAVTVLTDLAAGRDGAYGLVAGRLAERERQAADAALRTARKRH